MTILDRLKISTKLWLLVALAAVALVAATALAGTILGDRMMTERVAKMRSIVDAAAGVAQSLEDQVGAGALTRDQAIERFRSVIHGMRYDGAVGYLTVNRLDGISVANGAAPQNEGKSQLGLKDAVGTPIVAEMTALMKRQAEGTYSYVYPKPGGGEPLRKVSYLKRFDPWGVYILTGLYVDDLAAEVRAALVELGLLALVLIAATVGLAWLVGRNISRPLAGLKGDMAALAAGNLDVTIAAAGRRDEIGAMAQALAVFKDGLIDARRLAEAQDRERAAKARRQAVVEAATEDFLGAMDRVAVSVSGAAGQMRGTAQALSANAEQASQQSSAVAAASDQAAANVQTVASASEELSSSIAEISRQVGRAAEVADGAVAEADRTNDTIRSLSAAAQRIGDVVKLIADIAGQTNLLALNATIEAARAGDAGKGFAVVASEVKQLASQTAHATGDIGAQVQAIQAETQRAVQAIEGIAGTIGSISEITGSVAVAVQQQGAATGEIARNVQEAARGTAEVTSSIAGVSDAARETGQSARAVQGAADQVVDQAAELKREVERFLARLQAA